MSWLNPFYLLESLLSWVSAHGQPTYGTGATQFYVGGELPYRDYSLLRGLAFYFGLCVLAAAIGIWIL